jgi:hypothetical protein
MLLDQLNVTLSGAAMSFGNEERERMVEIISGSDGDNIVTLHTANINNHLR